MADLEALPVERKKIVHAAKALRSYQQEQLQEKSEKKPLFDNVEDMPLFLQVTLKRIPDTKNVLMIKIPLPHSLMLDTSEVCLFTGDLDKRDRKADIEPTVLHYKELLEKHDIKSISEVIPLRQLRTDYKPYEAKRKLVAGYDVFLAEEKIAGCLPKVLGKFFFKKRKFPQQIDLSTEKLKERIEKALSTTVLFLTGHGNTCTIEIARLGWRNKRIADNAMAAVQILNKRLPGSFANVHSIFLKTERSPALPVYMSFESGNDIQLPSSKVDDDVEEEEITTLKKTKVKVFPSGDVQLVADGEYEASESDSDFENQLLVEQNLRSQKKRSRRTIKKKVKKVKK